MFGLFEEKCLRRGNRVGRRLRRERTPGPPLSVRCYASWEGVNTMRDRYNCCLREISGMANRATAKTSKQIPRRRICLWDLFI